MVSGAVGAGLENSVIIILGFANLLADGFAMSVGAYLSAKTVKDNYNKHKNIEYWEVENLPEKERDEVVEIYKEKGFDGELLEQVVDVITSDKDRWVDVMMKEELQMSEETKSPFKIGFVTYISFISIGLIPLVIYVWNFFWGFNGDLFIWTSLLTSLAFVFIGFLKTYVTETSKIITIQSNNGIPIFHFGDDIVRFTFGNSGTPNLCSFCNGFANTLGVNTM